MIGADLIAERYVIERQDATAPMSPMNMLWATWAIGLVAAIARKHEAAIILSGLPWWHRVLGTAAAVAFYGGHLWP